MSTLEERLQRLEDIEAIRRLRVRYCQLCDANYDADGIAELFTEDAVWDGANLGVHRGQQAIRQFFAGLSQRFTFAVHYVAGEQIDIAPTGTEATGRSYGFAPVTLDGRAIWIASIYHDQYRKVDGRWLFSYVRGERLFFTPYELGWEKQRIIS